MSRELPKLRTAGQSGHLAEMLGPLARGGRRFLERVHWILAALALAYLASGITFVRQNEEALVLRFGRLVGVTPAQAVHGPGLLVALPRPIDEVVRVNVRGIRETRIVDLSPLVSAEADVAALAEAASSAAGAGEAGGEGRAAIDPRIEGYGLTGDDNILQAIITARWTVDDPLPFALGHVRPERALRNAVLAATVRTLGEMGVDDVLGDGRRRLVATVTKRSRARLEAAASGIHLVAIELEELRPPTPVLADFRAVQSAYIESLTAVKRASEYRESEIPAAEAEAETMVREAQAYAESRTARARGEADAFRKLLAELRRDPDVTRERLYIEALERALADTKRPVFLPPPAGERYEDMRITVRPRP
jgi:membrane protease subunit HflK